MSATLSAVAKASGVSLATASRAFSEPHRLSRETRANVVRAARELGYRGGHALPVGRTFALIVPDIANPVIAALVKSIQERAWLGRHFMMLGDSNEDPQRERELVRYLAPQVDGIIACSPRLEAGELLEYSGRLPLVLLNRDSAHTSAVLMDTSEGVRQAVEHLKALGHERIAYASGPSASWSNERRYDAVVDACRAHGIDLVTLGSSAASVQGGLGVAATVAACRATAVLAYNDLIALGIQSGLRSLNVDVPRDISVIGVDDLDLAAVSRPGLTSIGVPLARIGARSLEVLLDQLGNPDYQRQTIQFGSQLIVRESTAPRSSRPLGPLHTSNTGS
jgi:LacI family transcriptional regulator